MNLLTRITATIGATAETAVSRFENHEAIAQSALVEARQAVAKARIRHQRLAKSVGDIRSTIQTSEAQINQWTIRAQKLAQSDENRALECLTERQRCREKLTKDTQNLAQHETLEAELADRLKRLETRLQTMVNQCNEMRSRESLAQATQVMDRVDNKSRDGVDAIFERWELNISDAEIRNSVHLDDVSSVSSLQRQMGEEERTEALKDELAVLLAENKEINHE